MGARKWTRRAAATATFALLVVATAPVASAATSTGQDRLSVWTVNIHRFKDAGWKNFFLSTDNATYHPDIVLVQDIANDDGGDADNGTRDSIQFAAALEDHTKLNYRWRHSDDAQAGANVGNAMVLWRNDRFDETRISEARWKAAVDNDGDDLCGETGEFDKRQIAVRLWDLKQTRWLVAASVHYPVYPGYRWCVYRNVARTDGRLESLSPVRRLSIVGGDFNLRPDDAPLSNDSYTTSSPEPDSHGREADPDCWYRWFSAVHDNTVDADGSYCDRGVDPAADTYYDTVWAEQAGANPSDALCDQWTHTRQQATNGNACTDVSGPDGTADGLLDRNRIDYVWVRWEDPEGNPRPFDAAQAGDAVLSASVDPVSVNDTNRYSDHRAVQATIRWCLTTEAC